MTYTLALLPVLLLALGFPVFLVLLTASAAALLIHMNMPMAILQQTLFGSVGAYALVALPFFIFAGELMDRGRIADRLILFVQSLLGRVPGRLPLTAVGAGAIFGAISGVGAASVASVGKVLHPAMGRAGYGDGFSSGLLVSVGAVGVIIPPSIPMIVYAAAAEESIPKLYAAGLGPGLLICLLLAVYVIWVGRRIAEAGGGERRVPIGQAFRRGIWALGVPVVILGGIYAGVFSPTEAAAVACVYAVLVTAVFSRDLSPRAAFAAARSTVFFTAQILIIIACAGVFSWVITVNQVPAAVVDWMQAIEVQPWALLLVINLILLLAGCVIDPISAILLLTPLLIPVVQAAGIDTVHFGMIMTVNLAIGLFTPPFGINIFVMQSLFGIKLQVIYRGTLPFLLIYLVALGLVTFVPEISRIGVDLLGQ